MRAIDFAPEHLQRCDCCTLQLGWSACLTEYVACLLEITYYSIPVTKLALKILNLHELVPLFGLPWGIPRVALHY